MNNSIVINEVFNNINITFHKLFVLTLVLLSAWSSQLLPHQLINIFETNRGAQLIVLFMLIMFTIDLFNPEIGFHKIISRSILMFLLYLIITKQSLYYFIATIVCLIINAIISNHIEHCQILLNKAKTDKERVHLQYRLDMFQKALNGALVITICIIVYGFSNYLVKQYKDHFTKDTNIGIFLLNFLFEGSNLQRNRTGNVLTSIKIIGDN